MFIGSLEGDAADILVGNDGVGSCSATKVSSLLHCEQSVTVLLAVLRSFGAQVDYDHAVRESTSAHLYHGT